MALTGGFGLPVVPPVALWLLYLAVLVWHGGSKGRALILALLALLIATALRVALTRRTQAVPRTARPVPESQPTVPGADLARFDRIRLFT